MASRRSPLLLLVILILSTVVGCAPGSSVSPHRPQSARSAASARHAVMPGARRDARRPVRVVPAAARRCPAAPYGPSTSAPGGGKTVALTFDDGPGRTTAQVLAILRAYRVPATFFNIGENEARRPSLVRAEADDGEAIGDHTWNHPDMASLSAGRQAAELDQTIDEQKSIVGFAPCGFRPPYGDYDATTLRLAQQRRLAVWLWSVDTEDYLADGSGSSYWVQRIIRTAERVGGAQRHPIVIMHNQPAGNPATVSALPTIIRFFGAHGYHFVRL
jgi:peptidoglycan/xylan/chitin deacetylase (PgdA/CDA1 family)